MHLILIQPTCMNSQSFSLSLQGADKTVKGPDGLTAFEATDNQAIKTLLQWRMDCYLICLSCGLTLLPVCHSLHLPASSAKYFGGEGNSWWIRLVRGLYQRWLFWRGLKTIMINVALGLLFSAQSLPVSSENRRRRTMISNSWLANCLC